MKPRSSILVALALVACRSSRGRHEIRPDPGVVAPSASPAVVAYPVPSASSSAASKERALSVLVEGPCYELGVSFFENATLVHYGHIPDSRTWGESRAVLAMVGEDGALAADSKLSEGLPPSAMPELDIGEATGTWPSSATLVLFSHGSERAEAESHRYVWHDNAWVDGANQPDPPGSPWISGSSWLSGTRLLRLPEAPEPRFGVVPDGGAPIPTFAPHDADGGEYCKFRFDDLVTRPNGDLFLAGLFCGVGPTRHGAYAGFGGAAVARWSPGKSLAFDRLPGLKDQEDVRVNALAEASATTLYAIGVASWEKQEPYVAFFDGSRWSHIATTFHGFVQAQAVDPDGLLWVRTSKGDLLRYDPGEKKWAAEPLKEVTDAALSRRRVEWAIASGALVHRGESGAWSPVPVPGPAFTTTHAAFSLKGVKTSPRGELWVSATYGERRPEWPEAETREALLRYGAPAVATRCDKAKGASFGAWPPPATADCSTLFVILARISASAPADYDYPQTRSALRGHKEMAEAQLVEVDIDGKRVLGAKVKSMEVGKRLVAIQGRMVWSARPELVCSDPRVLRVLPLERVATR